MQPDIRKHSCRLGIDYVRKLIFCAPEEGNEHVVLTTSVLYAWHVYTIGTDEGISHGVFIKPAGYVRKDLALMLLDNYKIIFLGCKEIFVYGLILSEHQESITFGFDETSTRTIQGSPFLYRKTVFISHANIDKPLVRDLASRIERTLNVWLDEKQILVGDSISKELDRGLIACDALILCLSRSSIDSDWVRKEYAYALHKGKKVLPIRLDDCEPPPSLADIKYIDYRGNEEGCVKEIFDSVEKDTK